MSVPPEQEAAWARRLEEALASAQDWAEVAGAMAGLNDERLQVCKTLRPWSDTWWEELSGDEFDVVLSKRMTTEEAHKIKELRCEQDASYRYIAMWCSENLSRHWRVDWALPDHQEVGTHICGIAASLLGENPNQAPWN